MATEGDAPLVGASGAPIRGYRALALIRELALGTKTQRRLGTEYGVTQQGIADFKRRHADRIADVKANTEREFAGLWVAIKRNRIAEYQRHADALGKTLDVVTEDFQPCDCDDPGCTAKVLDQSVVNNVIKRREASLRAVAEELGQLPNRMTLQVQGGEQPVLHQIVGVDPDDV